MKIIIDRETNTKTLVDGKKLTIVEENVQLLYSYRIKENVPNKNKVDIVFSNGKKEIGVEVEYLGEDKLDTSYIENKLK